MHFRSSCKYATLQRFFQNSTPTQNIDLALTESEEELVGKVYNQDYLLVDDNGEYKVVTIEQRFALPHLLYLEGWRSAEAGIDVADHMGTL